MDKQRILIIDDDEHFTRILKLNLEKRGPYEIREENRGRHTLKTAREFKPDLILLDVMMPDIDGGEVAAQLKSDFRLKSIPIVFLTAAASKQEVEGLDGSIGGYSFLAKPATLVDVQECLRKHLGDIPKAPTLPAADIHKDLSSNSKPAPQVIQMPPGSYGPKFEKPVPRKVLVPALAMALVVGVYWGYHMYIQPQRILQHTLAEIQRTIQERQTTQMAGVGNLGRRKFPRDLRHKAGGILGAQILSVANGQSPSSLLKELAVSIVKLRCLVTSSSPQTRRGSGILYRSKSNRFGASPYFVQTSMHVVKTADGSSPKCKIYVYPDHTKGDMYLLFKSEGFRFYRKDVDFAVLEPQIVEDNIHAGTLEDLATLAREEGKNPLCKSADIGNRLSILGYPAIGGETLTVTEGIISGFEFHGDTRFIKSSAKLDHGNSGGLAIKESGCVVGIPTFVQRGPLESMGRILDLKYLHEFILN